MSPTHIEAFSALAAAYAVLVYGAMLGVASLLLRTDPVRAAVTTGQSRYGSLDGLRGILATGVFIHHSVTSYVYFTTGQWKWGSSPVLNELGQSTVALFFMITGFLFALKAASPKVDWKALYVSRIARLGPLYAVVVLSVFAIVLLLTGGHLHESPWAIAKEFFVWITFLVFGGTGPAPDVNGYRMTWTLIAGVNWSLKYEALFYVFGVPALHVAARLFSARVLLALAIAAIGALFALRWRYDVGGGESLYLAQFLGGIITAYAFQIPALRAAMSTTAFRVVGAAAAGLLMTMTHAYTNVAIVCGTLAFAAVVGGASLFGLLKTRAAIWLGDISYGIYLIHGLLLWLTLSGLGRVIDLSTLGLPVFVAMVLAISVAVVLLASLSYVALERPVMLGIASKARRRVAPVAAATSSAH